eukprot:scaffold2974_cov288-Chaetoceros_neogracile.AAC.8
MVTKSNYGGAGGVQQQQQQQQTATPVHEYEITCKVRYSRLTVAVLGAQRGGTSYFCDNENSQ